jgi:hypothetical protein
MEQSLTGTTRAPERGWTILASTRTPAYGGGAICLGLAILYLVLLQRPKLNLIYLILLSAGPGFTRYWLGV